MIYLIIGIIIDIILCISLCIFKNNKIIWNTLLCLSLLPLIYLLSGTLCLITSTQSIGFGSVMSILTYFNRWYFYVPATAIFMVSLCNIVENKEVKEQ